MNDLQSLIAIVTGAGTGVLLGYTFENVGGGIAAGAGLGLALFLLMKVISGRRR